MQLSVWMCVIGSLICNQNDKVHVILTILFLQCNLLQLLVQHGEVVFAKKCSGTLLRAVTHGITHAGPAQCALQDIFSTDESSLVIIVATEKSMSGLSPSCNWKEEVAVHDYLSYSFLSLNTQDKVWIYPWHKKNLSLHLRPSLAHLCI